MTTASVLPAPPENVARVFAECPAPASRLVMDVRALIFETAASLPEVGPLTETLKWGQPAYLTEQSRSGTTLRLGWDECGTALSLFVHCQTSLIGEWRTRYGDELTFVGNREISIPADTPLPRAALRHCIAMALTYHSRKTKL